MKKYELASGTVVESTSGHIYMLEYHGIPVCAVHNNFIRLQNGYSASQLRLVNAFRAFLDMPFLTAQEWKALPVVSADCINMEE